MLNNLYVVEELLLFSFSLVATVGLEPTTNPLRGATLPTELNRKTQVLCTLLLVFIVTFR